MWVDGYHYSVDDQNCGPSWLQISGWNKKESTSHAEHVINSSKPKLRQVTDTFWWLSLSLSFLLSRSRPCSKTRWIPWEWIHRNSYLGLHSVLMTWNPFLPSRVLFKSCDSRRWSISYSTKVTSTLTYLVLGSISGSQRCFKLRIALLEYLIHEWFLRSQFLYFRLVEICGLT